MRPEFFPLPCPPVCPSVHPSVQELFPASTLLYLGLPSALEVPLTSHEDQRLCPPLFLTLSNDMFPFLVFTISFLNSPGWCSSSDTFRAPLCPALLCPIDGYTRLPLTSSHGCCGHSSVLAAAHPLPPPPTF